MLCSLYVQIIEINFQNGNSFLETDSTTIFFFKNPRQPVTEISMFFETEI
jgi:hypothetical protein